MPNQSPKPTPEGLAAAQEELDVVDVLAHSVNAEISGLSKGSQSLGRIDANEFALIDNRHKRLKALQELAHRVYGRTVVGTEVDENDRAKGAFTYRITQANVGFVEKGCIILARNSKLASELVTAQPGDQRDVETPGGDRYLNVRAIRTLDGPVSLRSPSEEPNFRSMAIRRPGLKRPIVVDDLRATLRESIISADETRPEAEPIAEPQLFDEADPTWLINWNGIYLGDADNQSLGHQFITRTTVDQERALSNPRGLTFVEGVAGAGKTSVALGRLKFFANFESGVERDRFGLQAASDKDFAPAGMAGFVLSHSLKRYLKDTADSLELVHLPIKDFEEFRGDLLNAFGISNRFKRKKGSISEIRSRMDWLRALDVAMAHAAAARLKKNLLDAPSRSSRLAKAIGFIASDLSSVENSPEIRSLHMSGLAARVIGAVAEAELRDEEDRARVKFPVIEKEDNQRRRNEAANLERELERIQRQADRKLVSPLAVLLLAGLTSQELFLAAVTGDNFMSLVQASFASAGDAGNEESLARAVAEIRGIVSQPGDRPSLPECDLVALVIFAGMIAEGFDYTDPSRGLPHNYQMRRRPAVFIDEVQDFTEIEIVLMGMSATSAYNQITLSGDRHQQLQSSGAQNFLDLFPWVPRSARNQTIFLDHNFRQRSELVTLSSGFRSVVLSDNRVNSWTESMVRPACVYRYDDSGTMAEFIIARVRELPHRATIAIVTPTVKEAQRWFDMLDDDLSAYHRPALMSRRDDLTKRVNVHFTEVRETKGLEFDVVIVPDVGAFEWEDVIGRNQIYVAISRAKQSLMIGCANRSGEQTEIGKLVEKRLMLFKNVPAR